LHGELVNLHVFLDHHLLEGLKVVTVEDLLDDAMVSWVSGTCLTGILELFSRDSHFCD